ncbi:MAG: beta-ketoacyl-[acyl-carrier-protein] synthase family protein [Acidobacteria bacterium]|nr:beta-ketoacyl-[acyl-carrier-protein] synthase family protein [Acidobacteriota bacterium]
MRRVVVTGMGIVSPLGNSPAEFFQSLLSTRSGIRRITAFDPSRLSVPVAAEADFDPAAHFTPKQLDLFDRFTQMAVIAARQAVADAAYNPANGERLRWGVCLGTAYGGAITYNSNYYALYAQGNDHLHPLTIPRLMHNASTSAVAMEIGAQGPSLLISTACSSAAQAIGEAMYTIRSGRADRMLAGGSDAPITFPVMRGWEAMRVLAAAANGDVSSACRPFSADRNGLVVGEGAGVLLLEEFEAAKSRGAKIYAELAGYGSSSDAGHITHPSVDGPARAMQAALDDAALRPEEIGYINAHGTGTRINDPMETRAIKQVFAAHASRVPVSSTKALHGHLMGASGAVELIAAILAMQNNVIPPTAHLTSPDPDCDLDYVPNTPRKASFSAALSNSFAFGGLNAVLAVKRIS